MTTNAAANETTIPVIGRGDSLAIQFAANPSTTVSPTDEQTKELEAHIEEETASNEDDVEALDKEKLSDERAAAIELLKESQGWVFPKVKVCIIVFSF